MSFLTTRVVSRRSLLQSRVHLFSTPAINNVEIKSKLPPFQTPLSSETTNAVGKYYHSLLYKGRQKFQLTLGDLRKLLLMVEDESNVKYAVLGIQLYQRKGHDFNEELCSHFIRACVRGNKPSAASELIIDFSNRIGAWASATSFHHLVEALLKVEDKSLLIPTFEMVVRKGLKPAANTLVLLEEFISQETDEEMKKKGLAGLDKLKA